MKVFKFGGASVKDASSVKNVAQIISHFNSDKTVVVISAMGKTTNELEKVVAAVFGRDPQTQHLIQGFKQNHLNLVKALFENVDHPIYTELHNLFVAFDWVVEESEGKNYAFVYDQIICFGELVSTLIVSCYLNEIGIKNQLIDARDYIKTNSNFQEGIVDWQLTQKCILNANSAFSVEDKPQLWITQGFIGSTDDNYTTSLGREGSDYSAAIFAYCLGATEVTLWKDVPGLLNADPKWFNDTVLIEQLSYQDALELAYYGATVIHPKTIKPLQNKGIPLYVRSFLNYEKPGTKISAEHSPLKTSCFIFKVNQALIAIAPKDFSFIAEDNLGQIFKTFFDLGIKIHAMQNSALEFSVCTDFIQDKIDKLLDALSGKFIINVQEHTELITIRYYDQQTIERVTQDKEILLDIRSRSATTCQIVVKNKV